MSDEKAWLCLQQGDTAQEWYAYASVDLADVEAFQRECREQGAYSTTSAIEIPATLIGDRWALIDLAESVAAVTARVITREVA